MTKETKYKFIMKEIVEGLVAAKYLETFPPNASYVISIGGQITNLDEGVLAIFMDETEK